VLVTVVALALVLAVGYWQRAAILRSIGGQLIREDRLTPASAIVVLSGGVPARELEAADLFKQGIAPVILLPHDPERQGVLQLRGRGVAMETELELRLRILRTLGVPSGAIVVLDPEIQSTDREAVVVVDYAASHQLSSLVVVTSAFHTGRVKMVYGRLLRERSIDVAVRKARAEAYAPDNWWHSRVGLRDGLIEWQKLWLYRIRP